MKKFLSYILIIALVLSLSVPAGASQEFTIDDAIAILRHEAGLITLSSADLTRYDLNKDDKVDINDAIFILRLVAGLITIDGTAIVPVVNTQGNTSGNLANGGDYAIQGDWIYFTVRKYERMEGGRYISSITEEWGTIYQYVSDYYSPNEETGLYKIHVDGTRRTKINNDECYNINVVGDWIYYQGAEYKEWKGFEKYSRENGIYRIRTDGTGREKLTELNGTNTGLHVVGNWIYYIINANSIDYINRKYGDGSAGIYRIRTNGTGKERIVSGWCRNICVVDNWIYYEHYDFEQWSLNRIRTNGTEKIRLSDNDSWDSSYKFYVVGDYIFTYGGFGSDMFLFNTDGKEETSLKFENIVFSFNVDGDWIYYGSGMTASISSGGQTTSWNYSDIGLFKIRIDGTDKTAIDTSYRYYDVVRIHVLGDWIYYRIGSFDEEDSGWYKIRTDGTERQRLD